MEKLCFFTAFIFTAFYCNAQEQSISEITPVVVESNRKFFADDHSSMTIDLQADPAFQQANIGYVLLKKSPVVIRNYGGSGSLTSVSMHGTGSNHTQVTWNGIPLNSPTTGQADLSLLPAGFIQQIEIINGASGSLFGSGTFGGSINLSTEADWDNRFKMKYSFQAGTYGNLAHLASIQTGKQRFQYHLSVLSARAENNFSFRDIYASGSPVKINRNNYYSDAGILQNIYIDAGKGHYVEAGLWYQKKLLGIPSIMGTDDESRARQKDSLFRAYLSYRIKTRRLALQVRSAYLTDHINYVNGNDQDAPSYINSTIQTSKFINEADFRHFLSERLNAGAGISNTIIKGNSGNYGGEISEVETALYGGLKYILKDFIINAGFRKEFYEGINPLPQVSAGVRYKPSSDIILRATFSTKFRKPSLNEKYWHPGGNPDLNPEKGRGAEVTAEWNIIDGKDKGSSLSARITTYYQIVDNWIQWIIRDSLTPVEYRKVHSGGLESWIDYSFKVHPVIFKGFVNYNYNRSVIKEVYDQNPYYKGKQMIYVPVHSSRAAVQIIYKSVTAEIIGNYTGKRETAESGDTHLELDPYTVWDASLAFSGIIGPVPVQLGIQCDNLFNAQYEIIRSYPVPGRTLRFSISLGFQKQKK